MKHLRFVATLLAAALALPLHAKAPGDFPRLFGMNIGRKYYDDPAYQARLAKLDVVIIGFYRGWNPRNEADPIGSVLRNLKRLNPAIKVGQYTILNETYDDPTNIPNADVLEAVTQNHWWLLNAAGNKVQWTPRYRTWEINATEWSPVNAAGQRYPDWLAARENRLYFQPHPEFDIWYVDNVMWRPRVTGDWDHDGKDDDRNDPRTQAGYRRGMASYWAAIRKLQPHLPIMGNTDSDLSTPEFRGKLDGAFLEGWMGPKYALERQKGWAGAMEAYRTTRENVRPGGIVAVNIHGDAGDFRFVRYGLMSSLMDDGYFSFSDNRTLYSSVEWFDEFDAPLGRALTPPVKSAWRNGVWRRDFAGGTALVNPGPESATVTIEPGFHRLRGTQDPGVNDGQPATQVTLAAKDGIILLRDK